MLGDLEVVPGDAAISTMCAGVFWFGVWAFFAQTLQRKYSHPVAELLVSATQQSLHGRVTADAVHTLIFFQHLPSSPQNKFCSVFCGVGGRGRFLF